MNPEMGTPKAALGCRPVRSLAGICIGSHQAARAAAQTRQRPTGARTAGGLCPFFIPLCRSDGMEA